MDLVGIVAYALLVAFLIWIYFRPAIVAFRLRHPRRWAILLLTLLTGWTTIGWIAALIWARRSTGERNEFLDPFIDPASMRIAPHDSKSES